MPPIPSIRRSRRYIFCRTRFSMNYIPSGEVRLFIISVCLRCCIPEEAGKKWAAGGWSVGSKLAMCLLELVHMFHLVLKGNQGANRDFSGLPVLTPKANGGGRKPRLFWQGWKGVGSQVEGEVSGIQENILGRSRPSFKGFDKLAWREFAFHHFKS